MLRALYFLEFRRGLVPSLILAIAAAAVVTVIERIVVARGGANPDSAAQASLLLLLAGIALSGLFAGARIFSREFKERHHLLLATLPVSPSLTWLMLTLAGLSASAVGIAALVLTHPRFVADVEWARYLALASATHLFLFATGSCLAVICRRPLFVPVLGFPIAAAILWETLSFDLASGSVPVVPRLISAGAATAFVLFLAASLACFVRGEFDLPKVRIRAHASLWIGLLSLVLTIRWVHPTPLLPLPLPQLSSLTVPVSPDGRLVVWVQREIDGRFRISFASGESGNPIGRWSGTEVTAVAWAPDEDVLWAAVRPEPLSRIASLFDSPPPVLVRIGSDGTELSRIPVASDRIGEILPMPDRRILVSASHPVGQRVALVAASGESSTVEISGNFSPPRLASLGRGSAVAWSRGGREVKSWLFVPGAAEPLKALEAVMGREFLWYFQPTVIGSRAFFSDGAAQEELLRVYSRPRGVIDGRYIVATWADNEFARIFHIADDPEGGARLDVWDRHSPRWREVARGLSDHVKPIEPLPSSQVDATETKGIVSNGNAGSDFLRVEFGTAFEAGLGLALYQVVRDGGFQAVLYEDSLARSLPLGSPTANVRYPFLVRQSPKTVAVWLRDPASDRAEVFMYEVGSGEPHAIPSVPSDPTRQTCFVRSDGSRIMTATGGGLAIRFADGTERLIRFR